MQAIQAKPFQPQEATGRKPTEKTTKSEAAATAKQNADQAAAKAAEKKASDQPPLPTTNNQGETIGLRLNVTA